MCDALDGRTASDPAGRDFGRVVVNATAPEKLVAINNDEPYTAVIGKPTFSGDSVFSITSFNTCDSGAHVSPYQLCYIGLSFRASRAGRYGGSVSLSYHFEESTTTKVVTVTLRGSTANP